MTSKAIVKQTVWRYKVLLIFPTFFLVTWLLLRSQDITIDSAWNLRTSKYTKLIGLPEYMENTSIKISTKFLEETLCYSNRNLSPEFHPYKLPDIFQAQKTPKPNKSIFFHETTCNKFELPVLNARQACAIESAALLNPNFDVFVLFASPVAVINKISNGYIQAVLSYNNVHFRNINIWTYAADTPIFDVLASSRIFESYYLVEHLSDFLRIITLWRYGGTYLDLDVISMKSLENVTQNFAGMEIISSNTIGSSVLNLGASGVGHNLATNFLKDFNENFDGTIWSYNGPALITRNLQDLCGVTNVTDMTIEKCKGFHVYKEYAFFPINYLEEWPYMFEKEFYHTAINMTRDTIAIHLWNYVTKQAVLKLNSGTFLEELFQKFCPRVYKSILGDF